MTKPYLNMIYWWKRFFAMETSTITSLSWVVNCGFWRTSIDDFSHSLQLGWKESLAMVSSSTESPPTESATTKAHFRLANLVLYISVLAISVTANILMLLVLWRKFRRHRRTAKSFIMLMQNLALSGLVLVISSIPFDLVSQSSDKWPFGAIGCKILWPLQTAALQAMVYTYVALACHRLCGVTK